MPEIMHYKAIAEYGRWSLDEVPEKDYRMLRQIGEILNLEGEIAIEKKRQGGKNADADNPNVLHAESLDNIAHTEAEWAERLKETGPA